MSRTVVLQGFKYHPYAALTTDLLSRTEWVGNSDFLAQPAVTTANTQTSEPESLFEGSNYTFCWEVRQRREIWRAPALSWSLKSTHKLKSSLQDASGLVILLAHMQHFYSFPTYCFCNISALKLSNTTFCKSSLVTISVADLGCCTVKLSRSF